MSNPAKYIENQLPQHYKEYYPLFISFMKAYYEWLNRTEGFTAGEVEALRNDTSWITTNVDSFMQTGSLKYMGTSDVDTAIIELGQELQPGAAAGVEMDQHMLENQFAEFITADESYLETNDGYSLDQNDYSDTVTDKWLATFGYSFTTESYDLNPVSKTLLVRLLKHIYNIKGTKKSIQLFFSMYFGENVDVYYPKVDIAVIDDNFVPDGTSWIRDDNYRNEYSYVILTQQDPSVYQTVFEQVFMKYVHPSGFSVFLQKQV